MLPTAVILLFLAIAAFSYWKTRRVVHPAVVVSLVWGLWLWGYQVLDHGLYPLSDKFYDAVSLWVIPFCAASLLLHDVRLPLPGWIRTPVPKNKLVRLLFPIMTVLNVLYLLRLYVLSDGVSFYSLMTEDGSENMPLDIRIMSYLNKVTLVLCGVLLLTKTSIPQKWKWAFVAIFFACLILISVKTPFFQLFFLVALSFYFSRRLSFSKGLLLAAGLCIVVGGVQVYRSQSSTRSSQEFDGVKLLTIYALSPLTAFDKVLNGELVYKQGRTLRFFSAVTSKAGIGEDVQRLDDEDMWTFVPLPTNVYTVMCNFYVDYGYTGIGVFAAILGLLWGFLYKGIQQHVPQLTLLFCLLFYSLPLQFFSDYIFTFFSVFLQTILIIHLLFVRYTFKFPQNPACK